MEEGCGSGFGSGPLGNFFYDLLCWQSGPLSGGLLNIVEAVLLVAASVMVVYVAKNAVRRVIAAIRG
jgi:hypothetical protein